MSGSESRIRSLADEFARTVVGTLRSMTIDELAGLVQVGPARLSGAATNRPAKRAAPAKKAGTAKAGTVIKRKDGRTFTNTAKAIKAHKLQGQYIGNLRKVPEKEQARIRKIVHEKGVAAAVAALMKRLGKA